MTGWWRRWRERAQREREIAEELEAHLDHARARLMAEGLSPAAADREARRRLGNATRHGERLREVWGFPALESAWGDLRFAFRLLARDRIFAAVALVTLTLGIGANAAVFVLLDGLLLRTLPLHRPDELVRLGARNLPPGEMRFVNGVAAAAAERWQLPFPLYERLAGDRHFPFRGLAGMAGQAGVVLDGAGGPREIEIAQVTGNFFSVLELQPQRGRLFTPAEDVAGFGGPWPLVLSDAAWSRLYGRDPAVIGAAVSVERVPYFIAGVAPAGFTGLHPGAATEAWSPLSAMEAMYPLYRWRQARSSWMLEVYGRLKDVRQTELAGAMLAQESPELMGFVIEPAMSEAEQARQRQIRLAVRTAAAGNSHDAEQYATALWLLVAAVGAVLLIAATNLTNLLLARSAARGGELGMRLALGASPGRLRRQLLLENSVLVAGGAAGGALFAGLLLALWQGSPDALWQAEAGMDWRVVGFLAAVLGGVTLIAGWLPAWSAARGAGGRVTASRGARRLRAGLIVLQTALSFALLGLAGLLGSSLASLLDEPTGFAAAAARLYTPDLLNAGVPRERMPAVYDRLLGEARRLPGVGSAAWTRQVPLAGGMAARSLEVPGRESVRGRERMIFVHEVSDGYFDTLGIPLAAGEDLAPAGRGRPGACVLSENAARAFFGSAAAAIGRRVRFDGTPEWLEVRGVAADAKYMHIREAAPPTIYVPYWAVPVPPPGMTLAVRPAPPGLAPEALTALFTAAAGSRPFVRERSIEANRASSVRAERWMAAILGSLAGFGVLMSITGIAGLLAYDVAQRRREIGIRLALGAPPASIRRQIAGAGLRLAAAGILAGMGLALAGGRAVSAFLYRLDPLSPAIWLGAAVVLLAAAGIAAALPAARAARLDPGEALRNQ